MGRSFEDDPLTRAMAPPPDETEAEKATRERTELEARKVSDQIDEQIKKEKVCDRFQMFHLRSQSLRHVLGRFEEEEEAREGAPPRAKRVGKEYNIEK